MIRWNIYNNWKIYFKLTLSKEWDLSFYYAKFTRYFVYVVNNLNRYYKDNVDIFLILYTIKCKFIRNHFYWVWSCKRKCYSVCYDQIYPLKIKPVIGNNDYQFYCAILCMHSDVNFTLRVRFNLGVGGKRSISWHFLLTPCSSLLTFLAASWVQRIQKPIGLIFVGKSSYFAYERKTSWD